MPPPPAPSAAVPAGGLVVVTVDRLPAWMLSAWGATWVSTPTFDGLAAAGVTLDRLIATSVDPRDTLAAIDGRGGLWSAAASAGWRAALVTDDPRLPERRPGVDVVEVPAAACGDPAPDVAATNLARLFTRATDLVGAGNHRLVWCHAGSLGVAWDAPLAFRDAYVDPEDPPPPRGAAVPHFHVTPDTDPDVVMGCRQAFAGQLTLLDACLAALVGAARSLQPSWAFALVGLRGMPLGLHGEVGCGSPNDPWGKAYGEWVHLPAILVAADSRMAGQRYGGLAVPADVGATLVDLAVGGGRSVAADPPGDSRSLAGLFADWTHEPRERVVVSAGDGMAIATDGWHLVMERTPHAAPRARLFVKPDDFFELSDVADRCPRVAEELASALGPGGEARVLSAEARGP